VNAKETDVTPLKIAELDVKFVFFEMILWKQQVKKAMECIPPSMK
jgi:hypothetical protein